MTNDLSNKLTTAQIIQALRDALLYEAAKQQVQTTNVSNLFMLVAVATGVGVSTNELQEVFNVFYNT